MRFTLLLVLFPLALSAQKYSNEFLVIGVGARAHGMGNAVISSATDVTAAYWNPGAMAAISDETGLALGAMHAEWFAGVGKYDYIGASIPMNQPGRRLGLSMIRFGIDGIPNTLSLYEDDGSVNYDNIVEFSAADYAFLVSYAQRVKKWSLGGNVKVVRRVIGSFANSWGFGLDVGALYQSGPWSFAAVGRDLTSTFNAWRVTFTEEEKVVLLATGNDLPDISSLEITRPSIVLGGSRLWMFNKFSLRPEVNLFFTTDGKRNTLLSADPISMDPSAGLEVGYKQLLYLRAGVNQFQRERGFEKDEVLTVRPTVGLGLRLGAFALDYAYSDLGDSQNRYSHIISLLVHFKKKEG